MKKGFTLIELLVLIAIIGILVSVIMTAVSHGKGEAKKSPKQHCQDIMAYTTVDELPAGCLQYVNIPDWYKTQQTPVPDQTN